MDLNFEVVESIRFDKNANNYFEIKKKLWPFLLFTKSLRHFNQIWQNTRKIDKVRHKYFWSFDKNENNYFERKKIGIFCFSPNLYDIGQNFDKIPEKLTKFDKNTLDHLT